MPTYKEFEGINLITDQTKKTIAEVLIKNSIILTAALSLLAILLIPVKSYASVTIEDIIKTHKLDIGKYGDRCDLPFLIENDYVDTFNSDQIEYYNVIVGDYSKNNDSGITFRVSLDKNRSTKIASFYDRDRFYILKLQNGELIANQDGYFVPFDKLEIGDNNFKLNGRFVVLQKTPPQDKIKYFYVNKCKVQIFNNNN